MPNYPIKCACGYCGDTFAKVAELVEGWVPCPDCGKLAEQDYTQKNVGVGNRVFTPGKGQVSMTEGWHPKEVNEVRELLGDRYGQCVQNSGKVKFADRAERNGYMNALTGLKAKVRAKAEVEHKKKACKVEAA